MLEINNNTMRKKVEQLLKEYPECRNNRDLLMRKIFLLEGQDAIKIENSISNFIEMEKISRYWRKVQEVNIDLRGSEWIKRQEKASRVKIEMK